MSNKEIALAHLRIERVEETLRDGKKLLEEGEALESSRTNKRLKFSMVK